MKLILKGRPATKKNSQRIAVTKSGKRFIIQSKRYLEYEKNALWQLKAQYRGDTIQGKIELKVLYYLADKRLPDLINLLQATCDILEKARVNLLQATCDILEKARVIENDRNIISFDGSKIMGIDKDNPRCEIEIKSVD